MIIEVIPSKVIFIRFGNRVIQILSVELEFGFGDTFRLISFVRNCPAELAIVYFRSAVGLPYGHRSVANTDTCSAPNILGRHVFFSPALWRLVWTGRALSRC